MLTDIIDNVKTDLYLPLLNFIVDTLLTFVSFPVKHGCVENMIPALYPLDWHTNDASICLSVSFSGKTYPGANNSEDRLINKQLFDSSCWYSNFGTLGWDSIWPVFCCSPNRNRNLWRFYYRLDFNISSKHPLV